MKLYYDHKDTGKIYLPVAKADMGFSPLVGEERSKMLYKLLAHSASDEVMYFEQFNNSFYIRTQKPYDLSKELSAYDVAAAANVYRKSMKELGQNPFQRPYLTLSFGAPVIIRNEIRKDTQRSSVDVKAELQDRSNLSKARQMLDGGDLEGAQILYLRLKNSKDKAISAEADRSLKEIDARKEQQKAEDDAAERRRLEEQRKQQAYDSMMKNNYQPKRSK